MGLRIDYQAPIVALKAGACRGRGCGRSELVEEGCFALGLETETEHPRHRSPPSSSSSSSSSSVTTTPTALFRQTAAASDDDDDTSPLSLSRSAPLFHRFLPSALALAAHSASPSPRHRHHLSSPSLSHGTDALLASPRFHARDVAGHYRRPVHCGAPAASPGCFHGRDMADLNCNRYHFPSPGYPHGHDVAPPRSQTSHCLRCECPQFPAPHFSRHDMADSTPPHYLSHVPHRYGHDVAASTSPHYLSHFPSPSRRYGPDMADSIPPHYLSHSPSPSHRYGHDRANSTPPHCPSLRCHFPSPSHRHGHDMAGSTTFHYRSSNSLCRCLATSSSPCPHQDAQQECDAYDSSSHAPCLGAHGGGSLLGPFHSWNISGCFKKRSRQHKDGDAKKKLHLSIKTINILVTSLVSFIKVKPNNNRNIDLESTNELERMKTSHQNKKREPVPHLQLKDDLRKILQHGRQMREHQIENREIRHSSLEREMGGEFTNIEFPMRTVEVQGPLLPSSPSHSWLGKAIPLLPRKRSAASYMLNKEKKDCTVPFS